MKVPKLRFRNYKDEWQEAKFGSILNVNQGLQIPISQRFMKEGEGLHFYITNEFLKSTSKNSYYISNPPKSVLCTEEDILMTRTGNTGMVVTGVKGAFHNNFFKIKYPSNVNRDFLVEYLRLPSIQKIILQYAGTSTIPDLNHSDFFRISLKYPSISEQQKIADFLTSVDEKINLLKKKKELLEQYKKGVMQKIFSQELRFKDDEGKDFPEWEEYKLKDILNEHGCKNVGSQVKEVFSVAKNKGVINQIEHLGRSFAATNVSHYKVLKPHDVVYTKSPTSNFPFGIIKQNKTGRTGIVSPLYGVFTPQTPQLGFILDYYFSVWQNTFNYLNPLVQKGAKNTMNIHNDTFLNGSELSLPTSPHEQQKIADFLSGLDDKITLVEQQINKIELWKKGLLQQMFV